MTDSDQLQPFDESHFLQPPPQKLLYTQEQKDQAIQLLNEGAIPASKIADLTGPTCSASNPYRWRVAEQRKREAEIRRQAEVAEEERERREAEAAAAAQQLAEALENIGFDDWLIFFVFCYLLYQAGKGIFLLLWWLIAFLLSFIF